MLKAICMKATVALALGCLMAAPAFAGANPDAFQSINKGPERGAGQPGETNKALDCGSAISVMLDNTYSGTTVGAPSLVSTYGCSPWSESGPEVVYILELTEPTMFTIDVVPEAGVDLDLAVLDACDPDLGCLIVVDTGVETLSPLTGTFYLVVEGYGGAAGAYDLVLETQSLPVPLNFCEQLLPPIPGMEGEIVPAGSFDFNGDTCDGTNDFASLPCGEYTENGYEDYWEFMLLPGGSIDVAVTSEADGALWLVDNCAEPINCLAYADNSFLGETEEISYTNLGDFPQLLILVVDSYGTDSCGSYTGNVVVNQPGVVPVEPTSWSSVKSRY